MTRMLNVDWPAPAPAMVNIVSCKSKSIAAIHRDLYLGLSLPGLVRILSLLELINIVNDGMSCRWPLLTRGYLQQARPYGILLVARQSGQRKRDRYFEQEQRLDARVPDLCYAITCLTFDPISL